MHIFLETVTLGALTHYAVATMISFPERYMMKRALCEKSMTCFYKCMEFEQKGKRVRVGNEEMLESAWRSAKNKSYAWTCLPKQTDTPSCIVQAFEKKS